MIAYTNEWDGDINSLQISEFTWINDDDYVLSQTWDVDTKPSGLIKDETFWTEEDVKEYFNAKALQLNVSGQDAKGMIMNVRQDFVMIIYNGVIIPIPLNFLVNFPLEEELRKLIT